MSVCFVVHVLEEHVHVYHGTIYPQYKEIHCHRKEGGLGNSEILMERL